MPRLLLSLTLVLVATLCSAADDEAGQQAARDGFLRQFPDATIQKIRADNHENSNMLSLWTYDSKQAVRTFKIEAKDPYNENLEAEVDRTGKLVRLEPAKIPLDRLPDLIRSAAEKEVPGAKWNPLNEARKEINTPLYWKLKGHKGKKSVSLRILESGEVLPKSK